MPPTTLTDHATPTEPGFRDAEYVVEATACERELLAWHWTHLGGVVVRDAEPGGSLYARAIGALDDVLGSAPLCVAVRWSVVSGHRGLQPGHRLRGDPRVVSPSIPLPGDAPRAAHHRGAVQRRRARHPPARRSGRRLPR